MAARSTYNDFVFKDKIGSGSYGIVWKVVRKVDRQVYAMKEIDLQGMTRKEQEECIRETQILSQLDSDYIIRYYDSFLEKGKLFIVTEYAASGNLHDFIKRQPSPDSRLPEELVWKLFIQMLLGLNHMHGRKMLHRDFKTLNVFLDDKMGVKLGDMGVAKILTTHTSFARTIVGTPYYLSPELCEDKPYNEKSDVWALGVSTYECCTRRHPFDADNQGALILKILRGKYPPIGGSYSKDLQELVKACLTLDARKRPDTERLLALKCVRDHGAELGLALPPLPQGAKSVLLTLSPGADVVPAAAAPRSSTGSLSAGAPGSGGAAAGGMQRKPSASSATAVPAPAGAGIKAAAAGTKPPAAKRPSSSSSSSAAAARPGSRSGKERELAAAAVADLPSRVGGGGSSGASSQGVIRVAGDMDKPPQKSPRQSPRQAGAAPVASPTRSPQQLKPFVFGGKAPGSRPGSAQQQQQSGPSSTVDVRIRHRESVTSEGAEEAGPDGTQPLQGGWSVAAAAAQQRKAGSRPLTPEATELAASLDRVSANASPLSSPLPWDIVTGGTRPSSRQQDTDRLQQLHHMRQQLEQQCVQMVGQSAFESLHELLQTSADEMSSSGISDGSVASQQPGGLCESVLRVVPESQLDVLPQLLKLLYLEGQLGA